MKGRIFPELKSRFSTSFPTLDARDLSSSRRRTKEENFESATPIVCGSGRGQRGGRTPEQEAKLGDVSGVILC